MTIQMMLRAGIFAAACVMLLANTGASAEDAQGATAAAAPEKAAPKPKKKHSHKKTEDSEHANGSASTKASGKSSNSAPQAKRGQYGSEAEAKAHCKGEVVWVDKDHFNHYAGSREYGVQPGAFACES